MADKPRSIQEAQDKGLIKDVYLPGVTATGITNVILEEWDVHAKPGVLIQGHTIVRFPRRTKGYLNDQPTELSNGDYVKLHDTPLPNGDN